jgi:ribosomal protein L32E
VMIEKDPRDAEIARLEHLLEQEHERFNRYESEKFLQLEADNWAKGIRAAIQDAARLVPAPPSVHHTTTHGWRIVEREATGCTESGLRATEVHVGSAREEQVKQNASSAMLSAPFTGDEDPAKPDFDVQLAEKEVKLFPKCDRGSKMV